MWQWRQLFLLRSSPWQRSSLPKTWLFLSSNLKMTTSFYLLGSQTEKLYTHHVRKGFFCDLVTWCETSQSQDQAFPYLTHNLVYCINCWFNCEDCQDCRDYKTLLRAVDSSVERSVTLIEVCSLAHQYTGCINTMIGASINEGAKHCPPCTIMQSINLTR